MVHAPYSIQRYADAIGGPLAGGGFPNVGKLGGNLSDVSYTGSLFINRELSPGPPSAGNSSPPAATNGAAGQMADRSANSNLDMNGVVEQVYQMLVRRLASERQRKGI
jgi:hypothetical protein